MPHASDGISHYLKDFVYGSLDGAITTFAIVAASQGAHLEARVALVLGLANIVADGFSMGASNYMATRTEVQQERRSIKGAHLLRHGFATFAAFSVAGLIPLAALLLPGAQLPVAAALTLLTLAGAGAARGFFVQGKGRLLLAVEMTTVGALAGGAAYGVGVLAQWLVG